MDLGDELPLIERENGFRLAEIVVNNINGRNPQLIFVYPDRSIDNGDGYVRIDSDFNLGDVFAEEMGREITVKKGKYRINYSQSFQNGVAVLKVK